MNYEATYDAIVKIRAILQQDLLASAEADLQHEPALRTGPDPRKIQVLSAALVLEEFLSNAIAADAAEDLLFSELFDKIAVEDGKHYSALNEQLQNDPAFAVSEEMHQKNMETIRKMYDPQK